jgi:hypothetical protein
MAFKSRRLISSLSTIRTVEGSEELPSGSENGTGRPECSSSKSEIVSGFLAAIKKVEGRMESGHQSLLNLSTEKPKGLIYRNPN